MDTAPNDATRDSAERPLPSSLASAIIIAPFAAFSEFLPIDPRQWMDDRRVQVAYFGELLGGREDSPTSDPQARTTLECCGVSLKSQKACVLRLPASPM